MTIILNFKRVSDGKTVSVAERVTEDNDGPNIYYWTDGSGACDCNRAAYFGDPPDCSGRNYLLNITTETGGVLHQEWEE